MNKETKNLLRLTSAHRRLVWKRMNPGSCTQLGKCSALSSRPLIFNNFSFVCVSMHNTVHAWKSEDSPEKLVHSFYHVRSARSSNLGHQAWRQAFTCRAILLALTFKKEKILFIPLKIQTTLEITWAHFVWASTITPNKIWFIFSITRHSLSLIELCVGRTWPWSLLNLIIKLSLSSPRLKNLSVISTVLKMVCGAKRVVQW